MKRLALALAITLLGGCVGKQPAKKAPATQRAAPMQVSLSLSAPTADPRDPPPKLPVLIHLDIYQFDVPFGAISSNEKFWGRVDERSIGGGAATNEVLLKNGVRSGIAAKSDWPFFRRFFEHQPNRTRKTTITKDRVDSMDLNLTRMVRDEDLFYYNSSGQLQGRSYQSATNTIMLSFQPAPRDTGSVRMVLCPVVTTTRHRLQFTAMNQEYESPFEDINQLYDLDLKVDVPEDDFLILSPSRDAIRTTSIGGEFLVDHSKAERLEQILVIVPTFLRINGKPYRVADTSLTQH